MLILLKISIGIGVLLVAMGISSIIGKKMNTYTDIDDTDIVINIGMGIVWGILMVAILLLCYLIGNEIINNLC